MRIGLGLLWAMLCVACQQAATPPAAVIRFQLATPQVAVDSVLFERSATLTMELDHPGVEIYYAINQSQVSKEDTRYEAPIQVTHSQTISARAFHADFWPSETIKTDVRRITRLKNAQVKIKQLPSSRYAGSGPNGLVDGIKGSLNFGVGTAWMGFQTNELNVTIDWEGKREVSAVTISAMKHHGSWIFSPVGFEARIPSLAKAHREFDPPESAEGAELEFIVIDFDVPMQTNRIEIDIYPLEEIPAWHDGRGTTPWLFIDEIIIN